MKKPKIMVIIVCVVMTVFLSLWLLKSSDFFKDEVSSRAKKVWLPRKISTDYYG